jgi:hypothetical protein
LLLANLEEFNSRARLVHIQLQLTRAASAVREGRSQLAELVEVRL